MELRWVLLGLGVLVILGILLFGQGMARRSDARNAESRRKKEPAVEPPPVVPEDPVRPSRSSFEAAGGTPRKPPPRQAPEKVVALRLVPRGEAPTGETTVLALRRAGLEHGQFGIFHRNSEATPQEPLFSVARLTEPGSFDLTRLAESEIPGLSIFLALPGAVDPVERFDAMMEAARTLARELDAEILDEKGSSWSIQRERYLREELIQYRHQHVRG
jgi:cell division protein ZipA